MCTTLLEQEAAIDAAAAAEARGQREGTLPYEPADTPQSLRPRSVSPAPDPDAMVRDLQPPEPSLPNAGASDPDVETPKLSPRALVSGGPLRQNSGAAARRPHPYDPDPFRFDGSTSP